MEAQAVLEPEAAAARSAIAMRVQRHAKKVKEREAHITDGTIQGDELEKLVKSKNARLEAKRLRMQRCRNKKKEAAQAARQLRSVAQVALQVSKVQPQYRLKYNQARQIIRDALKLVPETAEQAQARLDYNLAKRTKLQQLTKEERRRTYPAATMTFQVSMIAKNRIRRALERRVALLEALLSQMHSEENKAYVRNQKLKKLICEPTACIIGYLTGETCNMDPHLIQEMDAVERLGLYLQLKRVNEMYNAQQLTARQRDNKDARSAFIIHHFHGITQSFNEGAVNRVLEVFFQKAMREESGASGRLALTCAISQQSFRSCNLTGYQAIADTMNRNNESGMGIMPSRNTIQQCGDEIAVGTKAVVTPIVDEDCRVYRVNLVDELTNITDLGFIQRNQSISTQLVANNLDTSFECAAEWAGCVVKIDTSNPILMAEIRTKAIDMNYSCDGFELASASNGGVGLIATFKGKEVLQHLNKDYATQCDNPEYGDRAGCHSINSVLFQGLAIGREDFDMTMRLSAATMKLVQELHRPGRLFYNSVNNQYYSFNNSITVDKKEGNSITVTGGGTYLTKFFDIYTDDNQETKGLMSWRQCDDCYEKGRRIHGATWHHFSHHDHDFSDYHQKAAEFSNAARAVREQQVLNAREASSGTTRISRVKSEDRTFKAREKLRIFDTQLYVELDNTVGPCHHRDVLDEDTRRFWREIHANDWRRSTVFKGLSMKGTGSRNEIEAALIIRFEFAAAEVTQLNQEALEQLLRDQISKKYVPMSKVMTLRETAAPELGELSDIRKLETNERIHGATEDAVDFRQRLLAFAVEIKLIDLDTFYGLADDFARRKLLLLFAKFIGNRIEYCSIQRDRDPIVTRIEMLIPCGLHNNIRIPSNLLTHLRRVINSRRDLSVVQRKLLGEKLEEAINKSIGSGTNGSFNYTYKGTMLQVVSLSGVKLVQVMDNWAALVNVVFADLEKPTDLELKARWCALGERFVDCMLLMNYKYDMTASEVDRFQLCNDLFTSCYRAVLGIDAETNYVQNMSAGVFRYYAKAYGSICAYNNTAMEACAGREQDFFQKGTQHDVDGHRGKTLIEAFLDHHMIGRAMLMDRLAPGTLAKAVTDGKTEKHTVRNEVDRARRQEKRNMQDENGLNTVSDRKYRAAYWDTNGKKHFQVITLQVGDVIPPKAKRPAKCTDGLDIALLKRLRCV